jgi:hypothetical protein
MNRRYIVLALAVLIISPCISHGRVIQNTHWPTNEWITVTPQQGRMDASVLAKIDPFARSNLPEVSSILVLRNGYIVFERY